MDSANLSCFSGLFTCSSSSFSRGGVSDRLFTLTADRYLVKVMLGCHVSFEQSFQKRCQIFVDHRLQLHKQSSPLLFALISCPDSILICFLNKTFFQELFELPIKLNELVRNLSQTKISYYTLEDDRRSTISKNRQYRRSTKPCP